MHHYSRTQFSSIVELGELFRVHITYAGRNEPALVTPKAVFGTSD
jgi:hypothetical protein